MLQYFGRILLTYCQTLKANSIILQPVCVYLYHNIALTTAILEILDTYCLNNKRKITSISACRLNNNLYSTFIFQTLMSKDMSTGDFI